MKYQSVRMPPAVWGQCVAQHKWHSLRNWIIGRSWPNRLKRGGNRPWLIDRLAFMNMGIKGWRAAQRPRSAIAGKAMTQYGEFAA